MGAIQTFNTIITFSITFRHRIIINLSDWLGVYMLLLAELTLSKWAINYNILNTVSNSRTLPSMFKNFSIKIKRKIFYFSWDFGTKNTNKGASWHQILTLHLAKCYMFHRLNTENWIICTKTEFYWNQVSLHVAERLRKKFPRGFVPGSFEAIPRNQAQGARFVLIEGVNHG